jgi:hypothetical protein
MLKSVDDVVEALGGTFAVSHITGLVPGAISNWRKANRIPPDQYLVIRTALAVRDLDSAHISLFGFKEPAAG